MGCGASSAFSKLTRDFPDLTPMLVMPFPRFKEQKRIMKSVKTWRDEALEKGWLVEFKPGEVAEGDQAWRGGGRGKKWPKWSRPLPLDFEKWPLFGKKWPFYF